MNFHHTQPCFGIDAVAVDGREVSVTEEATLSTAFGTLLHFRKHCEDNPARTMPKVLVVAPLSGHFATLLRNTVRVLLSDHDVYITNWHKRARRRSRGRAIRVRGVCGSFDPLPGGFGPAITCRGCVPAVRTGTGCRGGYGRRPKSRPTAQYDADGGSRGHTFNPTAVNKLASRHSLAWFEEKLISSVPWSHAGAGRRVYPGFVQLWRLMSMNVGKHTKAFQDLYLHLLQGDAEKARTIRNFYD